MLQAQASPGTPAPPNRDSPVTPQLAHFVTSPYEIALGASGLRSVPSEEHRACPERSRKVDFHMTYENLDRCGPRRGTIGQAFCEIARFEEHLCCRACAFEEVCTQAHAFHLPWGQTEMCAIPLFARKARASPSWHVHARWMYITFRPNLM
jgi:hypothetical protein